MCVLLSHIVSLLWSSCTLLTGLYAAPSGTAARTVHNGLKTDHLYVKLTLS